MIESGQGRTDFQALQNAFDAAATADIHYLVFDLPYYADHDLRQVPLRDRRNLLRQLMAANTSNYLKFSEDFEADAGSLLEAACRLGLEGVIGKRADSPYVSARSPTWIKLKCTQRQEFVIGGYTDPKGRRTGIGSLLLGVHDMQGHLIYSGNVGTGFDEKTLSDLNAKLSASKLRRRRSISCRRASRAIGSVRNWWRKCRSVSGPTMGEYGIRCFTACGPTRRPKKSRRKRQ